MMGIAYFLFIVQCHWNEDVPQIEKMRGFREMAKYKINNLACHLRLDMPRGGPTYLEEVKNEQHILEYIT